MTVYKCSNMLIFYQQINYNIPTTPVNQLFKYIFTILAI